MTVGECFSKILKLMNYYSVSGTKISGTDGNYQDLRFRALSLMEAGESELAGIAPVTRSYVLACLSPKLLHDPPGVILVGNTGYTLTVSPAAHALSFRTGQALTAAVKEVVSGVESTLTTVTTNAGDRIRAYTAIFTPNASAASVKIVFSGAPAHVIDLAVYAESYTAAADVPVFGKYRAYTLPDDFRALEAVHLRPVLGGCKRDFRDYLLAEKVLYLPWHFAGEATLVYDANPAALSDNATDATALSVSDAAAQALCFYVAAALLTEEDRDAADRLRDLYRDACKRLTPAAPACAIRCAWYRKPAGLAR